MEGEPKMNDNQFERWISDYCDRFPSVAAWLNDLEQSRPGLKAKTLALWSEALADVSYREAASVTIAMYRGDLEPVGNWQESREMTAATIRRQVLLRRQLKRRREAAVGAVANDGSPPPVWDDELKKLQETRGSWAVVCELQRRRTKEGVVS